MKIGVLGSGVVARTLASGFLKHGHQVMIGSRTPEKLADWATQNPKARLAPSMPRPGSANCSFSRSKARPPSEALAWLAHKPAGKTVMDATNPIADAPPVNGVLQFFTKINESLMEQLQREFPDANFVKAFNSVGAALMVNPQFEGGRPTMFICGNDGQPRRR